MIRILLGCVSVYLILFMQQLSGESIFSSRGSITKVDFAAKAASRGSTVFAANSNDGLIIWYQDLSSDSKFFEGDPSEKIFELAKDRIVMAAAGVVADYVIVKGEALAAFMKDVNVGLQSSTRKIAECVAECVFRHTVDVIRPLGVSVLIADPESNLYHIDSYGSLRKCRAVCIGEGSELILNNWKSVSTEINACPISMRYLLNTEELSEEMIRCVMRSRDKEIDIHTPSRSEFSPAEMNDFIQVHRFRRFVLSRKLKSND